MYFCKLKNDDNYYLYIIKQDDNSIKAYSSSLKVSDSSLSTNNEDNAQYFNDNKD